jgi:hypothetical protein
MPRRQPDEFDEDSSDWGDDPDELPEGVYHDDQTPTVPCPYCRREISELAQWCPHCENQVSAGDAPPLRRTWFWIAMMVLALAAAALWTLG